MLHTSWGHLGVHILVFVNMSVRMRVGRSNFLGIKSFYASLQSLIEFWYIHNMQSVSSFFPGSALACRTKPFFHIPAKVWHSLGLVCMAEWRYFLHKGLSLFPEPQGACSILHANLKKDVFLQMFSVKNLEVSRPSVSQGVKKRPGCLVWRYLTTHGEVLGL